MDQHYEEWSTNAPRGLLLVGAGVSVVGHAIVLKARKRGGWFFFGLIGLVLLNAGLSVFGEAVKHRTLYEQQLG